MTTQLPVGPQRSHEEIIKHKKKIQSFHAKKNALRSPLEKIADLFAEGFGTLSFLLANIVWFALWVLTNSGLHPDVKPFDPYPFGFLTVVVSLEAIILSIIILISQNRASKVDELRADLILSLNTISEQETSKVIELLIKVLEKHGVDVSDDKEIKEMLKPLNTDVLEKELNAELKESSGFFK